MTFEEFVKSHNQFKRNIPWYWLFPYYGRSPDQDRNAWNWNWRAVMFKWKLIVPDGQGYYGKGKGEWTLPRDWLRRYYQRRFPQYGV